MQRTSEGTSAGGAARPGSRKPITVYSTAWCGPCRRLKGLLDRAGIAYRTVDLDRQPEHGDKIVAATGGYRIVPTVEIEGDLLVNPTLEQVRTRLAGSGAAT